MGLRLTEGIDLEATAYRLRVSPDAIVDGARFDKLATQGLTWRAHSRIGVTERGMLLLDAILAEVAR
jgi:oxygen-independent coproporphyrinogen-3 oxidase